MELFLTVEEKINNVLMESSLLNLAFYKYNCSQNIFYFYDKDEQNVKYFFYVNEYSEAVYNKLTKIIILKQININLIIKKLIIEHFL